MSEENDSVDHVQVILSVLQSTVPVTLCQFTGEGRQEKLESEIAREKGDLNALRKQLSSLREAQDLVQGSPTASLLLRAALGDVEHRIRCAETYITFLRGLEVYTDKGMEAFYRQEVEIVAAALAARTYPESK